ncbi:Exosome complex component RRP41 [Perkinsus olseni]|uniref:Exosome complex component RRP41 n=1 Tax=Perkinsus olseni TaxID=32597 RepID=A0A7J6LFJ0_PEROL|nr:Exosome complex component RRP41 [Perkinsus olseni]
MSRRQEFLSYEGFRLDGRRPNEIRYLTLKIGDAPNADGSATLQQGLTKVVAHVFGPRPLQAASVGRAAGSMARQGEAIVNVIYRTASFATIDRKRRTTGDRNSTERQLWLQRIIQDAVLTEMFPKSCIDVHLTILQEDGSALAACANAAAAALVDAGIPIRDMFAACIGRLYAGHFLKGVQVWRSMCRLSYGLYVGLSELYLVVRSLCTVGLVNNQNPIVDLNHAEAEGCGGAVVTVAVYQRRKELNYLCLEGKINIESFQSAATLAIEGAVTAVRAMKTFIQEDGLEKSHPPKYVSPASQRRSDTPTRAALTTAAPSPSSNSGQPASHQSLVSASWLDFDFDGGEKVESGEAEVGTSEDRFAQTQSSETENATVEFGTAGLENTRLAGEGSGSRERRTERTSDTELRQSLSTDWTQHQPSDTNVCSPIKAAPVSDAILSTILSKEWSETLTELMELREGLRGAGEGTVTVIEAAGVRLGGGDADVPREEVVLELLRFTQTESDSHEVVRAVLLAIGRTGAIELSEEMAELMEKLKNNIEGAQDLEELWREAYKALGGETCRPVAVSSVELPVGGQALLPILSEGHRLSALGVSENRRKSSEGESTETRPYSPEVECETEEREDLWGKRREGTADELVGAVTELAGRVEGVERGVQAAVESVGVGRFLESLLAAVRASPRHKIGGYVRLLRATPEPGDGVIIKAPVTGYPLAVEKELERFLPWFAPTELETRDDTVEERKLKPPPPERGALGPDAGGRRKPSIGDPLAACDDPEIQTSCQVAVRKVAQIVSGVKRGKDQVAGLGRLADHLRDARESLITYVEFVVKQQREKGQLRDIRHPGEVQQIPYPFLVLDLLADPSYRGPPMALPRAAAMVARELIASTGPLASSLLVKRLLPALVGFPSSVAVPVVTDLAEMKYPVAASATWQALVAQKVAVEVMVRVGSSIVDKVPSVRPWLRCHVVNALGVPPKIRRLARELVDGAEATPKSRGKKESLSAVEESIVLPVLTAKAQTEKADSKKELEELRKSYEELHREYERVCELLEKSNRAQLEHAAARAKAEKELSRWRRDGGPPTAASSALGVVERMMLLLEEGSLGEIAQCYTKLTVAVSGGEDGPSKEELKMVFLAMFRRACETRGTELLGYALGVAVSGGFLGTATAAETQDILRCALSAMVLTTKQEALRSLMAQVCSEVPPDVLREAWKRLEATLDSTGNGRVKELLSRLSSAGA